MGTISVLQRLKILLHRKWAKLFMSFGRRTVFVALSRPLKLNSSRLKRKGLSFFSKENELFHGWAMSAGFHATMLKLFGKKVTPVFG